MNTDARDETSSGLVSPTWLGTAGGNPFHKVLGLTFEQVDPFAVITMPLCDMLSGLRDDGLQATGQLGQPVSQSVHGGAIATLIDVACAAALIPALNESGDMQVTTEMNVRYYRQPQSSPLTAKADVVHCGRRLAGVECVVEDADSRVIARGSATYMRVSRTQGIRT